MQTANLARREADLAVRHYPPESGDLYISKLGVFAGAVYRRIGTEARDWVTYPEEQGHFPMPRWVELDLLRKSGEFPMSYEELDDTAATVYEGI